MEEKSLEIAKEFLCRLNAAKQKDENLVNRRYEFTRKLIEELKVYQQFLQSDICKM